MYDISPISELAFAWGGMVGHSLHKNGGLARRDVLLGFRLFRSAVVLKASGPCPLNRF